MGISLGEALEAPVAQHLLVQQMLTTSTISDEPSTTTVDSELIFELDF